MGFNFKIVWTDEALNNLEEIIDYLEYRWTEKEIRNFRSRLTKQISLIEQHPLLFPVSSYKPALRKAVLSKQTIIL